MNTELTTKQKARVFAMHIGCALHVPEKAKEHWYPFDQHEGGLKLEGVIGNQVYVGRIAERIPDKFNQCLMFLRPLSAITDEDAFQLAQLLHPKANYNFIERNPRFIYVESQGGSWRICIDTENTSFAIMTGVSRNLEWNSYDIGLAYQFLIQRGYAVPLFIAPGHPMNGKTAIEMGLAIDATTV